MEIQKSSIQCFIYDLCKKERFVAQNTDLLQDVLKRHNSDKAYKVQFMSIMLEENTYLLTLAAIIQKYSQNHSQNYKNQKTDQIYSCFTIIEKKNESQLNVPPIYSTSSDQEVVKAIRTIGNQLDCEDNGFDARSSSHMNVLNKKILQRSQKGIDEVINILKQNQTQLQIFIKDIVKMQDEKRTNQLSLILMQKIMKQSRNKQAKNNVNEQKQLGQSSQSQFTNQQKSIQQVFTRLIQKPQLVEKLQTTQKKNFVKKAGSWLYNFIYNVKQKVQQKVKNWTKFFQQKHNDILKSLEKIKLLIPSQQNKFSDFDHRFITSILWEFFSNQLRNVHDLKYALQYKDYKMAQIKTQHVIPWRIPRNSKIGIVGDYGTGQPDAQDLLRNMLQKGVNVIINLGDVYYSGTQEQYQTNITRIIEKLRKQFSARQILYYQIPGNHDYYSGGKGYYKSTSKNPDSFLFFLDRRRLKVAIFRYGHWTLEDTIIYANQFYWSIEQLQKLWTGCYQKLWSFKADFRPVFFAYNSIATIFNDKFLYNFFLYIKSRGTDTSTGHQQHNPAIPFSTVFRGTRLLQNQLKWHLDKLQNFKGSTILLTHHQFFSRHQKIVGKFSGLTSLGVPQHLQKINQNFLSQLFSYYPYVSSWFWGHQHALMLFQNNVLGLQRPRLLGNSSFRCFQDQRPYSRIQHDPQFPLITKDDYHTYYENYIPNKSIIKNRQQHSKLPEYYDLSYAIIDLGKKSVQSQDGLSIEYYSIPSYTSSKRPQNPYKDKAVYSEFIESFEAIYNKKNKSISENWNQVLIFSQIGCNIMLGSKQQAELSLTNNKFLQIQQIENQHIYIKTSLKDYHKILYLHCNPTNGKISFTDKATKECQWKIKVEKVFKSKKVVSQDLRFYESFKLKNGQYTLCASIPMNLFSNAEKIATEVFNGELKNVFNGNIINPNNISELYGSIIQKTEGNVLSRFMFIKQNNIIVSN